MGPVGTRARALVCQDDVTSSEEFGVFSHFWSVAKLHSGLSHSALILQKLGPSLSLSWVPFWKAIPEARGV